MNVFSWLFLALVIILATDNIGYYFSSAYKKPGKLDRFFVFFFLGAAVFYAFFAPVNFFYALGYLICGVTQIFRVLKK